MQIIVFKTNLTDVKHISNISSSLNIHPNIAKWNVDLNDCDNVLRIETNKLSPKEIESMLIHAGYFCEELQ